MSDEREEFLTEVQKQRIADNACVPAAQLRALVNVLIAKGFITAKDLEAASARSP